MCGNTGVRSLMIIETRPPSTSLTAGGVDF
jgi:hypothetical protein